MMFFPLLRSFLSVPCRPKDRFALLALSVALAAGLPAPLALRAAPLSQPHARIFGPPIAPVAAYNGLTVLTGSGIEQLGAVHRARSCFGTVPSDPGECHDLILFS